MALNGTLMVGHEVGSLRVNLLALLLCQPWRWQVPVVGESAILPATLLVPLTHRPGAQMRWVVVAAGWAALWGLAGPGLLGPGLAWPRPLQGSTPPREPGQGAAPSSWPPGLVKEMKGWKGWNTSGAAGDGPAPRATVL